MLGIDPLTASTLMVLAASGGHHQPVCKLPKPAEINIIPQAEATIYDYSQSLKDLQQYSVDTIDPYGFHGVSATQGFMSGGVEMKPMVHLDHALAPGYKDALCLWYDKIEITIKLDPTIVIAQEVAQDRCMKAAVLGHEKKHVNIDRLIVNKYSKIMGKKVYAALSQRGFVAGPVKPETAQHIAERMQKTVAQIVEHEFKKMDLERIDRQRELDSLEEYETVNAKCPKYHKKRKADLRAASKVRK